MSEIRDSKYIGNIVNDRLHISGRERDYVNRVVMAYMSRMGYCIEYGINYKSRFILLYAHDTSMRKRLYKNKYWFMRFRTFLEQWELEGKLYTSYLRLMSTGFKRGTEMFAKRKAHMKKIKKDCRSVSN